MNIITDIKLKQGKNKDRVYVYINNKYCASIRERTWQSFNLSLNDQIDCEKLKEQESFVWKKLYGSDAWEKEKVRLDYVKAWLKKYIQHIDVKITGFGADSNEIIESHPDEKGEPDIQIVLEGTSTIVIFLEVTGTEFKRGNDYWVRPDKIDYIQKHSEKDIWIALHYADVKKIIWLQPIHNKKYSYIEKNLKGAIEYYVIFDDESPEVKTSEEFKNYLDLKVQRAKIE